jgi:hypothetical protein
MNYFIFLSFLSYFVYGIQCELVTNDIFDIYNEDDIDDIDDIDNEDKEDKDFGDEYFKFSNFEVEEDDVNVETNSENYEINYEIESKNNKPIEAKLKYESTNSSGFQTETKSRALIHGIQEWFDGNFDEIMQDSEKIGALYFVGENQYKNITYVGPDNYGVYDFTISENSNGFLTMIAHLTSNFTKYYEPNSMKFDIIIQDWIYQNNENQLALLMEYRTENETEYETETSYEEGYVSQKTSDPSLGYSALIWNNIIIYNNNSIGFVSTRMLNTTELNSLIETDDEYEGEQALGMWFCFSAKGSDNIYWDPNIGVYTTPLSSSSSSSSSNNYLGINTIGGIVGVSIAGCIVIGTIYYVVNKYKSYKKPLNDAMHQLTKL